MAIKGAHISSTIQERPSLFELLACDSLDATLYPAINKLLTVWLFSLCIEFNNLINVFLILVYCT